MANDLVRDLVNSGIHFGHRASRWNPKMAPYIFGKRSTIHIIDIRETVKGLLRAKKFVAQTVTRGKDVLFVGTKRQARALVKQHAIRCGMPYVTERWLGGTLTNFKTIRARLARLDELEAAEADGTALQYSKKMIATRTRELRKIKRNLDGIRHMDKLPGVLMVIDVQRERSAVREARILGIPTICLIDTDSDPDYADIPIPGNDDAIRSIDAILTHMEEAIEIGKKGRLQAEEEKRAAMAAKEAAAAMEARALAEESNAAAAAKAADSTAPAAVSPATDGDASVGSESAST